MDASDIAEYYTESHIDYRLFWGLGEAHGLHAGYHDDEHDSHVAAVEHLNRVLADRVDVGPDDRVLDCGCGVGGSTVWVAAERGARAVGVDLVPLQLREARDLAREEDVADRTAFARADFTRTPFPDDSFDVLWGIEAICHAEDKADFAAEAARLLADGGRLVLSDGFRTAASLDPDERAAMDAWLDGWAVPNLATVEGFRGALTEHGFTEVAVEDATDAVLPSSRRLYWASRVAAPVDRLLNWVGLRSDTQTANRVAARYQHETLRDGLWTYNVVSARR